MTAVSVDAKASDVSFIFEDSCNCCCFQWKIKRAPRDSTPVYVHDYGVVQKYDPRRTSNEIAAIKQSMHNLQSRLEYISQVHQKSYPEVIMEVEEHMGERFSEERNEPVTYGYIERINAAVQKALGYSA